MVILLRRLITGGSQQAGQMWQNVIMWLLYSLDQSVFTQNMTYFLQYAVSVLLIPTPKKRKRKNYHKWIRPACQGCVFRMCSNRRTEQWNEHVVGYKHNLPHIGQLYYYKPRSIIDRDWPQRPVNTTAQIFLPTEASDLYLNVFWFLTAHIVKLDVL